MQRPGGHEVGRHALEGQRGQRHLRHLLAATQRVPHQHHQHTVHPVFPPPQAPGARLPVRPMPPPHPATPHPTSKLVHRAVSVCSDTVVHCSMPSLPNHFPRRRKAPSTFPLARYVSSTATPRAAPTTWHCAAQPRGTGRHPDTAARHATCSTVQYGYGTAPTCRRSPCTAPASAAPPSWGSRSGEGTRAPGGRVVCVSTCARVQRSAAV